MIEFKVPDEVLADLYIKGARLPPERAASVLNGVGNKFDPVKIQEQLMINLPNVAVVDGNKDHHDKGGYGHKKDHKKVYATEALEEADVDGITSTDSSEGDNEDLPDELRDMLDDAPASGSFLELATQLQPGTGPCLDGDGKIQNGCFVVAYIVYMLMHGFVSLKQSERAELGPG